MESKMASREAANCPDFMSKVEERGGLILKDHVDEFINASMDEHKTCFTKTIQKMFGMSKIVAERNSNVEITNIKGQFSV